MNTKLILSFALLLVCTTKVRAQNVPGYPTTDVYLLNIEQHKKTFKPAPKAQPVNISNNAGYDNQPSFIEQLHAISYVSSRNDKPTDVYLYDLETGKTKQLTNNAEAEFSPKITPDGKHISVVKGGEQNLTHISLDGAVTEKLYTAKDSIGYYCWTGAGEIAAVLLTNPISLKLIDLDKKTEKYLTDSIGRNLFEYDGDIMICRLLHDGNWITIVDKTGKQTLLVRLPQGTEDFYVTQDGWLFSSDGSRVVYCNVKRVENGWQVLTDLKEKGISKILRLSVNKEKNKLAFVTDDAIPKK